MNLLGDFFMKVKTKLVIVCPYGPITQFKSVGHYIRIKALWSDRIRMLFGSGMFENLGMCTRMGNDQKEQYIYLGVSPESNVKSKKAPTSKYLKSLERNISLIPYCTSIMEEEDLNDLSEDYIIRLYDITVDLEILIDNSKGVLEKGLCIALEEILWKWKN